MLARSPALVLVAAAALLSPQVANAQEAPAIPPEARAEALRLHAEGMAHVEAERWALAAESFQQVHGVLRQHGAPRACVALRDRALALMRIPGREQEARDAFQGFLDQSAGLEGAADIRDWRSNARVQIAELDARIRPSPAGRADGATGTETNAPARTESGGGNQTPSVVGPIVLGVGAAMLLAGGIAGVFALVEHGNITAECSPSTRVCPADLEGRAQGLAALSVATDVLVWGGLAVGLVGALLTAFVREEQSAASGALTPNITITETGGVVQLGGKF